MKKKVISCFMALTLTMSILSGCGGGNMASNTKTNQAANEQTAENEAKAEMDEEQSEVEESVQSGQMSLEEAKAIYLNPQEDVEKRIEALLSQMTLEEKVAQMVQPEQAEISLEEIKQYNVGSILSGGGSAPSTGNEAKNWQEHINSMKQASLESRLGIPLLYGIDAVHGHNNVYGAVIFPHNIGLGAANDADLVKRIGEITAKEVRATGIQYTFAPTLGNARNERWGRTYECFGENVDIVTAMGTAYIEGFQGELGSDAYLSQNHVIACAKHYIGEGYTVDGINQGNVRMSEEEFEALLRDTLLEPYKAAVDAGVRTVMASFNSVNGLKCHENSYLINDVLKGELGFTGIVISDYNGVQQVTGDTYEEKVKNALNAGIDLFMEPMAWRDTMTALKKMTESGEVSRERIDDAVSRILRVKFEAGLFEEEVGSENEQKLLEEVGSKEHRDVAREAVRKSLVLLKNDMINDTQTAMQSIQDVKNVLVVGKKANDIGAQCGGWTITWEGMSKYNEPYLSGTSILQGIEKQLGEDAMVSHSEDGKVEISAETEAVLVVMGEMPYVETGGDRTVQSLVIDSEDITALKNAKASVEASGRDIPVIGIMIAGRPLSVTNYLDNMDAFLMAFLPGSEADGIAQVLFGDYEFQGVLNYTWPKYAKDIANKHDAGNEEAIQFAIGSGLKKDGTAIVVE